MARPRKAGSAPTEPQAYRHPDADLAARPEVGAQAHFKKARPAAAYRFDSSLAPDLNWDGQNPAREQGERSEAYESCVQRMPEVLRKALTVRLPASQTVTLRNSGRPAKTLALSAEAEVDKPMLGNQRSELLVVKRLEET